MNLFEVGSSFALGNSSYKLMGFEKDKPKVLLIQTSEKLKELDFHRDNTNCVTVSWR